MPDERAGGGKPPAEMPDERAGGRKPPGPASKSRRSAHSPTLVISGVTDEWSQREDRMRDPAGHEIN